MNLEIEKILLQKKKKKNIFTARVVSSTLRISCRSGRFILRVVTIFADRSDLDVPINDVLIQTDFTKISPGANHLALHQDVSFNLKGRLPPLLLNNVNIGL